MVLGRNKVPGWIKQGGGRIWLSGLVFATYALESSECVFDKVYLYDYSYKTWLTK